MWQRILTGIVLILLMLAGIFYLPAIWFRLLLVLIILLAAAEYARFFWAKNLIKYGAFMLLLSGLIVLLPITPIIILFTLACLWWLVAPYLMLYYCKTKTPIFRGTISRYLVGAIVFLPCLFGLVILRENFGISYLLLLLVLVWAADIGAYFVGKFFGKTLLAQVLSPKKTIEGLCGGLAASLLVGIGGGLLLPIHGWHWLTYLALVIITNFWSVIGDLFESMLKRQVGVKDSGNLLPGHGGVYDRIDSLTAAVPVFVLGLFLI